MSLQEVPMRDVRIDGLLIERARRRSDADSIAAGEALNYSSRDEMLMHDDALWGAAGEIAFQKQFLEFELDDDEWEVWDGPEYDFILFPNSGWRRVTVEVKSRILPRQKMTGTVRAAGSRYPWYTGMLDRNNQDSKADVWVQAIVTDEYVHLSGWAFQEEVTSADKLYKAENNPYCLPQEELKPLTSSALGGGAS